MSTPQKQVSVKIVLKYLPFDEPHKGGSRCQCETAVVPEVATNRRRTVVTGYGCVWQCEKKKGSLREIRGDPLWGWRRPTFPQPSAVSSARRGLTSLFGMGRGGPPRYSHRVSLVSDNRLEGGSDRGLTRRAWRWDGPLRARPSGY